MLKAAIVRNNGGVCMSVMAIWCSGKVAHQQEGTTSVLIAKDTTVGQQALVPTVQQSGLPTGLGYTPCFMLTDG